VLSLAGDSWFGWDAVAKHGQGAQLRVPRLTSWRCPPLPRPAEIRERRLWDISAGERFDQVRALAVWAACRKACPKSCYRFHPLALPTHVRPCSCQQPCITLRSCRAGLLLVWWRAPLAVVRPQLKQFVSFGLEHWGADSRGVETCRRFLLEMLSFTHRCACSAGAVGTLPVTWALCLHPGPPATPDTAATLY
jgi:hypothetical protein